MTYPAEWRSFYERHLLPREGGYVRSSRQETLLGVIARVWVDAIPDIPQHEIDAQHPWSRDQLNAIRRAPESQRPAMVSAWMRGVAQHLEPWGNDPGRTFERVRDGGNAQIVDGSHNLAFSIFYREYIRDTGVANMQVEMRTQESMADMCIRFGENFGYGLMGRALVDSGIVTETQLRDTLWNAVSNSPQRVHLNHERDHATFGLTPSSIVADGTTYLAGNPGYPYSTEVGQRALASLMQNLSLTQQQALFDEFGKWRRTYIDNHGRSSEKEGDMARTQAIHGTYAEYAARRAVRADPQIAGAVQGGRPGEVSVPLSASGEPLDVAMVQTATERLVWDGWSISARNLGTQHVAIELPDNMGVFRYSVRRQMGHVASREQPNGVERREIPVVAEYSLPEGVELLRTGERSALGNYRNPYTDTVVLRWRDPETRRPQSLVIGAELTEYALALPQSRGLLGVTQNEFATRDSPQGTRLDAAQSARLIFDGDRPDDAPGWTPPSNGTPTRVTFTDLPPRAPGGGQRR